MRLFRQKRNERFDVSQFLKLRSNPIKGRVSKVSQHSHSFLNRPKATDTEEAKAGCPLVQESIASQYRSNVFLNSLALEEFTDCCSPLSWVLGCQRRRGNFSQRHRIIQRHHHQWIEWPRSPRRTRSDRHSSRPIIVGGFLSRRHHHGHQ